MSLRYTLLFCASAVLLSACSEQMAFMREKYTGERYGDPVRGARRPPALNPDGQQLNAKVPKTITPTAAALPPRQVAPAAAPAAATPYEQYDAQGNDTTRTNYVKEWFGDKPQPQADTAPAGRKPFRGMVAATRPVELAPQHSAPVIEDTIPSRPLQLMPDEGDNGVMLPEPQQRSQARGAEMAQNQPEGAAPHLSSVPKAPPQFKRLKKTKGDNELELQLNYDAAQEEKRLLEEEPTDLPPSTLPQVEGMIQDIDGAINGDTPIVQAENTSGAASN